MIENKAFVSRTYNYLFITHANGIQLFFVEKMNGKNAENEQKDGKKLLELQILKSIKCALCNVY